MYKHIAMAVFPYTFILQKQGPIWPKGNSLLTPILEHTEKIML